MTKERHTRREFLGIAGGGAAGVATGACFESVVVGESNDANKDPQSADLVVYNAKVYTMDAGAPKSGSLRDKGWSVRSGWKYRKRETLDW